MFKSILSSCALALTSSLMSSLAYAADDVDATKAIVDLENGIDIKEITKKYEFSVVSFYKPSDEKSTEVDGFVKGAFDLVNKRMESGEWEKREVGWYRIDIESQQEIKMGDVPDQLIVTRKGLSRTVHFQKLYESTEANHETFAAIVRELTGDWITPIECDQIQKEKRFQYDEVVFFGKKEQLEEGGIAHNFNEASMIDKYQFDEQRNGFFYNEEPECRKLRGLEEEKSYIVWYNGDSSIPFILELVDEAPIDTHRLLYETTIRAVKGTPRWGQRANSAIFDFYQNGLVYIQPKTQNQDEMNSDWRVLLAVEYIHIMQEHETNFVPVIVSYDSDREEKMLVPSLTEMLGVELEELPAFFVIHSFSDKVVKYEDPLDDPLTISAQGILLWGRRTILYIEEELFQNDIDEYEKKKADGETIEDGQEEKIEQARKSLAAAQGEREVVQELIDKEIERLLALQEESKKQKGEEGQKEEDQTSAGQAAKSEEL